MTDDACAFCETREADGYGTASAYVRYPDEVEKEDRSVSFPICQPCAIQERTNSFRVAEQFRPGDRDKLGTCDICGAVGSTSASIRGWASDKPAGARGDGTFRVRTVFGWNVQINGLSGSKLICTECMPVQHKEATRYPKRDYDEDAPTLIKPPFDTASTETTSGMESDSSQADIGRWA